MNESIEIPPRFSRKYTFSIILVFADIGLLINIFYSWLTVDLSDLYIKVFLLVCSIPAFFVFNYTFGAIDWTTRVDKDGIHWWAGYGKTKDILWQEIGSIDFEKLIVFDSNGCQFHDLNDLRNCTTDFKNTFFEVIKDHLDHQK